nr:ribonuclease H-like domain-containing protein [Tanacetum cinerariifolium]
MSRTLWSLVYSYMHHRDLLINLLSWSSKRQPTISRSSPEGEYRGIANVVAETAWLRNLLRELHTPLLNATLVYCDNVSVVYLSANPVQHQQTKHIEIDIHFVRDMVVVCHVRVLHFHLVTTLFVSYCRKLVPMELPPSPRRERERSPRHGRGSIPKERVSPEYEQGAIISPRDEVRISDSSREASPDARPDLHDSPNYSGAESPPERYRR